LYSDLYDAEIIDADDSIWVIDRKNKYWYLEYEKSGKLFWRYAFFNNFFDLFSMKETEFEPIISDWVEEVLNRKVTTTQAMVGWQSLPVEEVLNRKVTTTYSHNGTKITRL
jgi:hypothetical protein